MYFLTLIISIPVLVGYLFFRYIIYLEEQAEKRKKEEAAQRYRERMIADGYREVNGKWEKKYSNYEIKRLNEVYKEFPGITEEEALNIIKERIEISNRRYEEEKKKKELELQRKKEKEQQEFETCKNKAESGDPIEQYNLALYYWNGEGIEKNYAKAIEYFTMSANQGDADAQYELADCYFNNNGVKYRDYDIAFEYYLKAAEQGHVDAQYMVGLCYEEGKGTQKDLQKAGDWYKKAADQNDEDAYESLDRLYVAGKWNKNFNEIKANVNNIEKDVDSVNKNYEKVVSFMESEDYTESAVNIRHILEITLKYFVKKYSPENIYDDTYSQIIALSHKNILNEHMSKIFHKLRMVSNKGAHVNGEKINKNDISESLAPLKEVIELYSND